MTILLLAKLKPCTLVTKFTDLPTATHKVFALKIDFNLTEYFSEMMDLPSDCSECHILTNCSFAATLAWRGPMPDPSLWIKPPSPRSKLGRGEILKLGFMLSILTMSSAEKFLLILKKQQQYFR